MWSPPSIAHLHIAVDSEHRLQSVLAAAPGGRAIPAPAEEHRARSLVALVTVANRDHGYISNADGRWRWQRYVTTSGASYVCTLAAAVPDTLTDLGILPSVASALEQLGERQGIVLVTGAYNAGKSLLAHTLTRRLLTLHGGTAFVLGDPPEFDIAGDYPAGRCEEIEIEESGYQTAAFDLKRSRARYALFGELRTRTSTLAAIDLALGSPLVIATSFGTSMANALHALISDASRVSSSAPAMFAAAIAGLVHVSLGVGGSRRLYETIIVEPEPGAAIRNVIRSENYDRLRDALHLTRVRQQA